MNTRLLVIWTQFAQMLVSIALAIVTFTHTATLPVVYLLAVLGGIAFVLDGPGRQTLTFELVGRQELPNAVALNSGLVNAPASSAPRSPGSSSRLTASASASSSTRSASSPSWRPCS